MTWKEFISPLSTLLTLATGISIFALKIGCLGNSLLRTAAEDQWVPVRTSCYKIWASIYVFQLMTRLDVMNKLYIYWNKCSTCSTNKAYTCAKTTYLESKDGYASLKSKKSRERWNKFLPSHNVSMTYNCLIYLVLGKQERCRTNRAVELSMIKYFINIQCIANLCRYFRLEITWLKCY
jgi:hypothetical protein